MRLETGYTVFVRSAGIDADLSKRLLNRFTLQGSVPEPVKVARLLAKSIATVTKQNSLVRKSSR